MSFCDFRLKSIEPEIHKKFHRQGREGRIKITAMRPVLLLIILSCAVVLTQCKSSPDQPQPKYNILLITIDTLRADHLSSYGYPLKTSPAIDQLAAEGVLFQNAFAQRGQTWPSLTSILTSLYPQNHGVRKNGDRLDPALTTIPEHLAPHGYKTGAIVTNMFSVLEAGFQFRQAVGKSLSIWERAGVDRDATKAGVKWLRKNSKQPFFLWVHYLSPHWPYDPPLEFKQQFVGNLETRELNMELKQITLKKASASEESLKQIRGLYDAEIAFVDSNVQRLLQEIKRLQRDADTLVVLTSDHGEELYERHSYFGHDCSIYDPVLRIPLIVRLPNVLPANQKIKTVVQSIDILPTMMDLLRLPVPDTLQGKSLLQEIRGNRNDPGFAYAEIQDKIASIRTDRWRYVYNPSEFRPSGFPYTMNPGHQSSYVIEKEELYDIQKETENLIKKDAALTQELHQKLLRWREESKRYDPQKPDPETEEELRSLGYIQ